MLNSFGWKSTTFAVALVALAACDNAEERAQGHFEAGVELIEAGDVERGFVELRNVLALNEFHTGARKLYAATLREQGDFAQSYAQYRHLVESDPNDSASRLVLARMSIEIRNWDEFDRQSSALRESNAELDGIEFLDFVARFRQAAMAKDTAAIEPLVVEGEELVVASPEDVPLRQILVEGYYLLGRLEAALPHMDAMIELEPENAGFYMTKATALAELNNLVALEDLLRETVDRFPDENDARVALLRLYAMEGRTERAEEFLRELAETTGEQSDIVTLIAYLRQVSGSDVALSEIEERLASAPDTSYLLALKAGILFDDGSRDEAIALMEAITQGDADEVDDQTNRYKVSLAKMLLSVGNEVGARQLVEEVLAADGSQIDALKMSATWLIQDDKPEEAIGQLRIALDQEPEDAETMTLMSSAHLRMGDRELAQDLLSLAVEASNNAPEESIRFAELLMSEGRYRPAEDVLLNALRNEPGNPTLLSMLAATYLETADWARATQVADTLRRIGSTQTVRAADQLQSQIIARRQGQDQAIAFLEGLIESEGSSDDLRLGLLRSRLASGQKEKAVNLAEELVAEFPDNPRIRFLLGNTHIAVSDYVAAAEVFESFIADFPQSEPAWVQLSRSLNAQGDGQSARQIVERGLEAIPGAPNLLWAKASFMETDNDIDGAIEIYEQLYERNSNSAVVANNLASLLATYREDDASLERAFTVGRRLRGTDVAPFQDTYGWILHRRGEFEEAVTYLEPAAEALSTDPIVQYHLAMTYLELGRTEDAKAKFERVIEIAGSNDPRPQIERAAAEIERLAAAQVTD